VGGLHLAFGNGVSDASVMVYILFFIEFLFGPAILQQELIKGNEWTTYASLITIGMLG
tara:strand:+ start:423 stop:596 length:174 start_codon:yes stop_codon:yes gene_type:complete